MSDAECLQALKLLHKYVTEYDSCANMSLTDYAEDLAMSMDETTDEADNLRREIESVLA
jgi:hypothetical protein